MKWFRVDRSTGFVVGVSDMSAAILERNLGPDQVALEWHSDVNPALDRWDFEALAWVDRTDEPPPPRYDVARYHAYPQITEQVGALVKFAKAVLERPDLAGISAGSLADIRAIIEEVDDVKRENPKPST